jgi:hypothetical protein
VRISSFVHISFPFLGIIIKDIKAFNLYLDAKETHNFFLRKVIYSDIFLGPIRAHLATFQKYPPKDILGD